MQRKHVNMIRSHGHECHFVRGVIRGHSTVASNQSSPPGMQRAVGYKMHCSFVSPIPFNYAVQKRRLFVHEIGGAQRKHVNIIRSHGHECHFAEVQPGDIRRWRHLSLEIRPIRAVLPACNDDGHYYSNDHHHNNNDHDA